MFTLFVKKLAQNFKEKNLIFDEAAVEGAPALPPAPVEVARSAVTAVAAVAVDVEVASTAEALTTLPDPILAQVAEAIGLKIDTATEKIEAIEKIKTALRNYELGKHRKVVPNVAVEEILTKIAAAQKAGKLAKIKIQIEYIGGTDGTDHRLMKSEKWHQDKARAFEKLTAFYVHGKLRKITLSAPQETLIKEYITAAKADKGKAYAYVNNPSRKNEFLKGGGLFDLALAFQRAEDLKRKIHGAKAELDSTKDTVTLDLGGGVRQQSERKSALKFVVEERARAAAAAAVVPERVVAYRDTVAAPAAVVPERVVAYRDTAADIRPAVLTPEQAEKSVATEGTLTLDTTALPIETAEVLANFKGDNLILNNLATLDVPTAKTLAKFKAKHIHFNGLKTLTPEVAEALVANYQGPNLFLNGLTTLDAATAEKLAGFTKQDIELKGLTSLDAATAQKLVAFRGRGIWLDGLTKIDEATATELRKFEATAGKELQVSAVVRAILTPPEAPKAPEPSKEAQGYIWDTGESTVTATFEGGSAKPYTLVGMPAGAVIVPDEATDDDGKTEKYIKVTVDKKAVAITVLQNGKITLGAIEGDGISPLTNDYDIALDPIDATVIAFTKKTP